MKIDEIVKSSKEMIESLENNFDQNYKEEFKEIADSIKASKSELIKYTSIIKKCAEENKNCKNCRSIHECRNKIQGYKYSPIDNKLNFGFVICKYQKQINDSLEYQKNIYYNAIPSRIMDASLDNLYTEYKERLEVIKWIKIFVNNYLLNNNQKGLYLYGNFGCGKTYLISAAFTYLAKKNIKSAIIFYPEFLRDLKTSFETDFKEKYDKVKNIPLLLIDDIGSENTTDWARDEILCPLIQYRMENNLTTFFTSNLNLEELESHFSKTKSKDDPLKSRRIIERIKQMTEQIEMISQNLRG